MKLNLLNRVGAATLVALASPFGGAGAAFGTPVIYNLGLLPEIAPGIGFDSSTAHGVSADGSTTTGFCRNELLGFDRGFRWTKRAGMEDLGTVTGQPPRGVALNADGSVIVGFTSGVGFNAFRWTSDGGMENLGSLGGGQSIAQGVNNDGSIVVGYSQTGEGAVRAFRWTTDAGMEEIGPALPGHDVSYAMAISGDGSVVAGTSESPTPGAVIWDDEGVHDLGVRPGFTNSNAHAISADGLTVVGISYTISNLFGFRWTEAEGMVDLEAGFGPRAVNADGSAIVGNSDGRAVLWTPDLGKVDLNEHLPTLGLDLTGWFLHQAWGISADGTVITGVGFFNDERRAFMVKLLPCPGDTNRDNVVNFDDLNTVLSEFDLSGPGLAGDVNGDAVVNFDDLNDVLGEFGAMCP